MSKFYPVFRFTYANNLFMSEFLNSSPKAKKKLSVLAVGTSQVVLSFEALKAAMFELPCKEEQDRIASFLDCLNRRIEQQRTLVAALKKYKRGAVSALLDRRIAIAKSDDCQTPWPTITLAELGQFFGGLSGKTKDDFEHGDSTFITYLNVYKNTFATESGVTAVDVKPSEKQNRIHFGDILFTQSSETVEEVGLSSVWLHSTPPYLNSFCMALRPYSLDKINPRYLGYALRSEGVRRQIMKEGQGISRINLSGSRIGSVKVPMPPLSEQDRIVRILDYIDSIESRNIQTLASLRTLKAGLLQRLFI